MKSFAKLYLDYLERLIICMLLASLILISISGFAYGSVGRIPATLAVITLGLIVYVELGRGPEIRRHPELKTKLFAELRLFFFLLQLKVSKIIGSFPLNSRKQATQQTVSNLIAVFIVALVMLTIWTSFSMSVGIAHLLLNQAVVGAGPGIPATCFNKAVVIDVVQVSDSNGSSPKVNAVIHSQGFPDVKIESGSQGYEILYNGPSQFRIQILQINGLTVQFFVERLRGSRARTGGDTLAPGS